MDSAFFTRLYKGFRAEYIVMGELYGIGMEGFKLPGDFGFDIIATNLKEATEGKVIKRDIEPPYSLQVKSAQVYNFVEVGEGRAEGECSFLLKHDEVPLIRDGENTFFVFVIFTPPTDGAINGRHFLFWMDGAHIAALEKRGYFEPCVIEDGNKKLKRLRLNAVVRLFPMLSLSNLLDSLPDGSISPDARARLLNDIADRVPANKNASEYVSLKRHDLTNPANKPVIKQVNPKLVGLKNLGQKFDIGNM